MLIDQLSDAFDEAGEVKVGYREKAKAVRMAALRIIHESRSIVGLLDDSYNKDEEGNPAPVIDWDNMRDYQDQPDSAVTMRDLK